MCSGRTVLLCTRYLQLENEPGAGREKGSGFQYMLGPCTRYSSIVFIIFIYMKAIGVLYIVYHVCHTCMHMPVASGERLNRRRVCMHTRGFRNFRVSLRRFDIIFNTRQRCFTGTPTGRLSGSLFCSHGRDPKMWQINTNVQNDHILTWHL